MANLSALMEASLETCLKAWPTAISSEFSRYENDLRRDRHRYRARCATDGEHPYWVLLPASLFRLYRRKLYGQACNSKFLYDILWAQHALFLSIRMRDDLFDGQANSPSLLIASDRLRLEAETMFSRYFERRPLFWKFYRNCLQSTERAIARVDRLQRLPIARSTKLLSEYAKVSAIFKVGSAAVCVKFERVKDYCHISRFADHMAIVGQILDDLEDFEEDLRRGRFNFVASCLLRGATEEAARNQPREEIAERLVYDHCLDGVLAQARRQLELSRKALFPLGIAPMNEHIESYERALNQMSINFHRQRVGILFDGHPRFRSA